MVTIHGMSLSGNCYKPRLLLELLGADYRWNEVDLRTGATRTPEFLALNPDGKVPVLELEDGRALTESNAMLCYLAEGTSFLPADRWQRAQVMRWMFFEQHSHEPYIAVARFIRVFLDAENPRQSELPGLLERGHKALALMEQHLATQSFFVTERPTIADIALFAYTHVAAEGGFDLSAYPSVTRWLDRLRAEPRFVPMQA